MGWTGTWPPVAGTDIQSWDYLSNLFRAYRDISSILSGNYAWPPGAQAWGSGTIVSVTRPDDGSASLVVDCGPTTGEWAALPGCSSTRFVNMTCPDCERSFIPGTYDLVIESPDMDDVWQTVRGTVTAQDWSGTVGDDGKLTIDGTMVLNWITGNIIPSLDALAGRRFLLVRASPENCTSTERMPPRPNDHESWVGTDSAGGTVVIALGDDDPEDPPTYAYLTDASKPVAAWASEQWVNPITRTFQAAGGPVTTTVTPPFEVLVKDAAGLLHRVTIEHNSADTLYWTPDDPGWTAAGNYSIVIAGSKGVPGRAGWRPFRFYSGLAAQYYGHDNTDDTVGLVDQPTASAILSEGDACSEPTDGSSPCNAVDHVALDQDLLISYGNTCDPSNAGRPLVRDYWTTFRALQTGLVNGDSGFGLCGAFVPRDAERPYTFTAAILFYKCGINAGSGTLGYDGTVWSFTADTTYSGYPVFWTAVRNGMPYQSGTGTPDEAGRVIATGSFTTHHDDGTDPSSDAGLTVYYSAGWTRYYPEWFRYFTPRTCFVPSTVTAISGTVSAVDPPTVPHQVDGLGEDLPAYDCSRRGTWEHRPASTSPLEGDAAFVTGHYYRLVGDNFHDPGLNPKVMPSPFNTALVRYWDHFYRNTLSPKNQRRWDAQKAGPVTSGTNRSLTSAGAGWWSSWCDGSFVVTQTVQLAAVVPFVPIDNATTPPTPEVPGHATVEATPPTAPSTATWVVTDDTDGSGTGTVVLTGTVGFTTDGTQDVALTGAFTSAMADSATIGDPSNGYAVTFTFHGALHTESGTATAGTATTLTDDTKDTTDPDQPWGCWWAPSAFQGRPAFQDFILEITKGDGTVYKTSITSTAQGAGGVVITFAPIDGLTVGAGDGYAIREPAYTINRWQGCALAIRDDEGNQYDGIITHSDDDTLFYDPVDGMGTPAAGWSFKINELLYGGVYKWDGEKMVPTAGADAVRLGVPASIGPRDFLPNIRCNLEGFKVGYGPMRVGDVPSIQLLTEIYWVENALKNTLRGIGWINQKDPEVPEYNTVEGFMEDTTGDIDGYNTYSWGTYWAGFTGDNTPTDWFKGEPSADLPGACADAEKDMGGAMAYLFAHPDADGYRILEDKGGNPSGKGQIWQYVSIGDAEVNAPPRKSSLVQAEEQTLGDATWNGSAQPGAYAGKIAYVGGDAIRAYGLVTVDASSVKQVEGADFWNYADFGIKKDITATCSEPSEVHFEDGGDAVAYRDWTKWSTVGGPDGSGRIYSDWLGSLTLVGMPKLTPPCPATPHDYYDAGIAGYSVTGGVAVLAWPKEYDGPYKA